MPTPDDINRNRSAPDDDDDGSEYELEPPDAEVIAAEERRAREVVEASQASIDIDEIYRETDRRSGTEILEGWARDANFRFRFRFQVKHLLIATAVLAIALTLWRLELLGSTLMLLTMITIAGIYLYVLWQEKQQQQEAERRRRAMYQRQREFFEQRNRPGPASSATTAADDHAVADRSASANGEGEESAAAATTRAYRLQFSLKQLFVAMTAAAVMFGIVSLFGGPANTATMLGFVALLGLVIHALGFEPPEILVLGWWLVLVMYIVLSIAAVVWSGFA